MEKPAPETAAAAQDVEVKAKDNDGVFFMYKRIFAYAEPLDWLLISVGALAASGSGSAQALIQLVFGNFVQIVSDFQRGLTNRSAFDAAVASYALRFIYIFIGRFVLTYIFMTCLTITGIRLSRAVRYDYLKATLSQEVAFFDGGEGGSVTMKVTTNGNQIQQGISDKLGLSLQAAATCVACIIVALIEQWKLALVTLTIAPVMIVVIGIVVTLVVKVENRQNEIFSQAGSLAEDVISSVRNVHAFWMRPKLVVRYDDYLTDAHEMGLKQSISWGFMFSIEYFCIYSGFALAFFYGVQLFSRGEISNPGPIVAVLFSVVLAATSLTQVSPFFQAFAIAASAASGLFKTIDRESAINPLGDGGVRLEKLTGDVTLEGVSFAYPTRSDVQVLHDYSLSCAPGKVTALVGPSGCGKSTIVGLLERWYNPTSGTIKIDSQPIETLSLTWLRTNIRLVQQEPVLLNGTVFQNVVYGLTGTKWETSSKEEQMNKVVEACKMAYAHDFVSELPEGYDTNVGERAGLLSGGQKQRIAIARALISDPKILLLDEATSALDPHSEGIVQQALDRAAKDRTTLVIAHKLATIRHADKIVVMQNGQVIEQGTHTALLERGEAYAKLVGDQTLGTGDKATGEDEGEEDTDRVKRLELQRSQTAASTATKELSDYHKSLDFDKAKGSNLPSVVWYVLREQTVLRKIALPWAIACFIGGATFPAQALILSNLINVFDLPADELVGKGNFYALMFFIVAFANLGCYFALGFISNVVGQQISHFYRKLLFDTYLKQDIQFFDRSENTTGAIASRLSSMPQQLFELFGFNLSVIFVSIVNLVSSSILALVVGWKLALLLIFAGLPPLIGSGYVKIRIEARLAEDTEKRFADSASLAGEAVAAIRTISSLAMERKTLERFKEKIDVILKSSMPFVLHSMLWYALSQSVEYCILALGFWYGCRQIAFDGYSINQFFIAFVAVFFSGQAAGQFFSYATAITKGTGAVNYIKWLRSLQPIVAETPLNQQVAPSEKPQSVNINDVGFTYPTRPSDKVLKGISIAADPGSFIALVGGSGSGKSTIVSLLERFYDPSTGTISLGSSSIATFNPRAYRSNISLVQQEPTLYQGTVRQNISLGTDTDSEASDEAILSACRQANIADFVLSLPEGLDTLVGTRGISLSGGQRQRIAIARALIRDPQVLLLDEATSALDTESERVVQRALVQAAGEGERITVAVAHRLSTIMGADRILVMVRGRVVESGTHAELVDKGGVYAGMCKAQSLDREV